MAEQKTNAPPDLSEFTRSNLELGSLSVGQWALLAGIMVNGAKKARPEQIGALVMDAIGFDDVVAWIEGELLDPSLNSELYYIRSDGTPEGERVKAEHEAWLRPLLEGDVLIPAITRAYCYGASCVVMTWGIETLPTIRRGDGGRESRRRLPEHAHYVRAHEIWPGEARPYWENDKLLYVEGPDGKRYGGQDAPQAGEVRAYIPRWRPAFGRPEGQGSRRRAYDAWFDKGYHLLWKNRYLERSVDPVRVGRAPSGEIQLADGTKKQAVALLTAIMQSTRNGSSITLPSTRDAEGNLVWDVDNLEQPDRSNIWADSLSHDDLRIARACLAPINLDGSWDETRASDSVQKISEFVARELTKIVGTVHALNHGADSPRPQVRANEIPKAKKRLMLEVFKAIANSPRYDDGDTYTLAGCVDEELIDQLGLPSRPVAKAKHAPEEQGGAEGNPPPGRPRDTAGDREERRDDARTPDAQEDTGGPSGGGREEGPQRDGGAE